ncbi:MAG: hypothetical protein MMC23_009235 [Stictis urceolatum]|nr:hypothetical protein [Stictis urceolata]
MTRERTIVWPPWFSGADMVSAGLIGQVCRVDAVIKFATDDEDEDLIGIEIQAYERFANRHHGLLRYYGPWRNGSLLQYIPNGHVREYLMKHNKSVSLSHRLLWIKQVTESLKFIHAEGVLHGDLASYNVFLDKKLDAKLGDFAGSSIDGSEPQVWYTSNHGHPTLDTISVTSEIFALGSTIYEIITVRRRTRNSSTMRSMKPSAEKNFPTCNVCLLAKG